MYFKGIIKNNETNFLACRIIGFVALIFLFFSRCVYRSRAAPAAAAAAQRAPVHCTDVIAKSSFALSGFFIIFIHVSPRPSYSARRVVSLPLVSGSGGPFACTAPSPVRQPERTLFLFMPDARDITPALLPLIKSSNSDRFMRYIIFYCYVLQGFTDLARVHAPFRAPPPHAAARSPARPSAGRAYRRTDRVHVRGNGVPENVSPGRRPRADLFFFPAFLSRLGGGTEILLPVS